MIGTLLIAMTLLSLWDPSERDSSSDYATDCGDPELEIGTSRWRR